jgi:hypothetical protein
MVDTCRRVLERIIGLFRSAGLGREGSSGESIFFASNYLSTAAAPLSSEMLEIFDFLSVGQQTAIADSLGLEKPGGCRQKGFKPSMKPVAS